MERSIQAERHPHDWYAVMGRKKPERIVTLSFVCTKRCALDLGGGLLMIAGALLSGWRGGRDE